MRDAWGRLHPVVGMMYFVLVIVFSCVFTHPICLGLSFVCAFGYSLYLKGRKAVVFALVFMLPMIAVTMLLNPIFNHEGATILSYLPDGNPLTLESIAYGVAAAVILINVVNWFSCYNEVMTSDKFVYLFGRVMPALSLVLSMALRFVPRFKRQLKAISAAQRCLGRDGSRGSLIERAGHGIKILSIMVTWALENAVETADSMKSRGYGLPGRTAFSIFRFDRRDVYALVVVGVGGAYIVAGAAMGALHFRYFPTIKGVGGNAFSISLYLVYFVLCAMPLIINIWEDFKWNSIQSKS